MPSGIHMAVVLGVPFLGIAICIPTLGVLFAAARAFGTTRHQRITNLIAGFCFSAAAAILAGPLAFDPKPNSWGDRNATWILVGIAPIGAAIGVAISVWFRRIFSGKQNHP